MSNRLLSILLLLSGSLYGQMPPQWSRSHVPGGGELSTVTAETFEQPRSMSVVPAEFGVPVNIRPSEQKPARPVAGTISVRDLARSKNGRLMKELAAADQAAGRHDYRTSALHLERAVAIDDAYAAAYVNLGVRYLQCGRPLGARGALLRAIELDPGLVFAYTNLAVADLNLGDPEAALEAGRAALRLEPGNQLATRVVAAARRQFAQAWR